MQGHIIIGNRPLGIEDSGIAGIGLGELVVHVEVVVNLAPALALTRHPAEGLGDFVECATIVAVLFI